MNHEEITALARAIEKGGADQPDFVRRLLAGLQEVFAGSAPGAAPGPTIDASVLTSAEAALALAAAAYPAWRIEIDGRARLGAGGWNCTIREGGTRDDDEVIGIGRGPTIALALLAAMLLAAARRAQGYV